MTLVRLLTATSLVGTVLLMFVLLMPAHAVAQVNSSLAVGDRVAVTLAGGGVRVRENPGTAGSIITEMAAGYEGEIVDGPSDSGGYRWWRIQWVTGHEGWTADSSLSGESYLQPLPGKGTYPEVVHNGLSYRVEIYKDIGVSGLRVRSGPSTSDDVVAVKPVASQGNTLADAPVSGGALVWWKITWDDGTVGWSADSQVSNGIYLVKKGATECWQPARVGHIGTREIRGVGELG
jgi:hypothetical protein